MLNQDILEIPGKEMCRFIGHALCCFTQVSRSSYGDGSKSAYFGTERYQAFDSQYGTPRIQQIQCISGAGSSSIMSLRWHGPSHHTPWQIRVHGCGRCQEHDRRRETQRFTSGQIRASSLAGLTMMDTCNIYKQHHSKIIVFFGFRLYKTEMHSNLLTYSFQIVMQFSSLVCCKLHEKCLLPNLRSPQEVFLRSQRPLGGSRWLELMISTWQKAYLLVQ